MKSWNTFACAVDWLTERGFLDDERYAAMVVRHYARKNYGAGRIRAELSRHGLPRELWDEALREAPEPDGQLERFLSVRIKNPEDPDQIRKASQALFRRGYSWEQIREALRQFSDCVYEDSV